MNNTELANQIYDYILHTDKITKEINWVRNLTLIDDAITVIEIWLKENEDIDSLESFKDWNYTNA